MRRVVVAFQQVQGPQSRLLTEMISGEPVSDAQRRRPPGLGRYWCAADRPTADGDDGDFRLAPVYRTHKVPERARCEECCVEIRELQAMMAPASPGGEQS